MSPWVRVVAIAAFLSAGNARAGDFKWRDRPILGGGEVPRDSHTAPEPLALIALGLGAAGIGVAAWRGRRKK